MATLTPKARSGLVSSQFAQPAKRAYPIPDASHAIAAKARATQAVNAGRMSPSTAKVIDAKANAVLARKK